MKSSVFSALAVASPIFLATPVQIWAADIREVKVDFKHNQAKLDTIGIQKIRDIADFIRSCNSGQRTYVYGFHDFREETLPFQKLSVVRAHKVAEKLASFGVDRDRIVVTGHRASIGSGAADGASVARNRVASVQSYCSIRALASEQETTQLKQIKPTQAERLTSERDDLVDVGASGSQSILDTALTDYAFANSEDETEIEAQSLRAVPQAARRAALAELSTADPSASQPEPRGVAKLADEPSTGLGSETKLEVLEFVLAEDVVDREPISPKRRFLARESPVFVFARVKNRGAPSRVQFIWQFRSSEVARFDTEIGTSVSWRTWSSQKIWPGPWRVLLATPDGKVLSEATFDAD